MQQSKQFPSDVGGLGVVDRSVLTCSSHTKIKWREIMFSRLFLLFTILCVCVGLNSAVITLRDGTVLNADIVGKQGYRLYLNVWVSEGNPHVYVFRQDIQTIRTKRGIMTDSTFRGRDWLDTKYSIENFTNLSPNSDQERFLLLNNEDINYLSEREYEVYLRLLESRLANVESSTSSPRVSATGYYFDGGVGIGSTRQTVGSFIPDVDKRKATFEFGTKLGFGVEELPVNYYIELLGIFGGWEYTDLIDADFNQFYIGSGIMLNAPSFLQAGASIGYTWGSIKGKHIFRDETENTKIKGSVGTNVYIAIELDTPGNHNFVIGVRHLFLDGHADNIRFQSQTVGMFVRMRFKGLN